jgi:hypothetical protein
MGPQLSATKRHRTGRPVCWQCGDTGHLRKDCRQRRDEKDCLRLSQLGFEKRIRDDTMKAPAS